VVEQGDDESGLGVLVGSRHGNASLNVRLCARHWRKRT